MFIACMTIATVSEKILVVSGGSYTTYASTSTSGSYVIVAMVFLFVMNFAYGWGPPLFGSTTLRSFHYSTEADASQLPPVQTG